MNGDGPGPTSVGAEGADGVGLAARLLGDAVVLWRDRPIEVRSRKSLAMLVHLVVRPGSVGRGELAELLWGAGRLANVRQALYELRRLPGADRWLVEGDRISVVATSDVAAFEEAVRRGDAESALELWGGSLLNGFGPVAPAFHEWLEMERARLDALHQDMLHRRVEALERAGALHEARAAALDLTVRDPLNESALRAAMRLSYFVDDAPAALELYDRGRIALRADIGVEPVQETRELARAIGAGRPVPAADGVGRLQGTDLRLIRLLAIAGAVPVMAVLAAALGVDGWSLSEAMAGLQRRGLLDEDGVLPPGVAAEVRKRIPAPVRRHIHAALAQGLEATIDTSAGDPLQIAEHWHAAGEAERAASAYLRAARAADERLDEEARRHAFRALWMGDQRVRLDAALLLEALAERRGDEALQGRALEEGRRIAWDLQDDRALARTLLVGGRHALRRRAAGEALELMAEASAVAARLNDPHLTAQADNGLGSAHFFEGDLDAAEAEFGRALGAADTMERYRALNNLGAIDGIRGRFEAAYARFLEALTLARESHVLVDVAGLLNNLAATAERAAEYERAVRHLREARELARRAGDLNREAQMLVNTSVVVAKQGALGPAWNTAAEIVERDGELAGHSVGSAVEQLAEVARLAGDHDLAGRYFDDAIERFERLGDERKASAARSGRALTEAARSEGRDRATVAAAEAAIESLEAGGQSQLAGWHWAELALLVAAAEAARRYADRAAAGPSNRHLDLVMGLARLRADLLDGHAPTVTEDFVAELGAIEVVERPRAFVLLEAAVHRAAGDPLPFAFRADEGVREQAAGLPAELRSALLSLPDRWRAELGR